jgi:hypothetical protein
MTIDAEDVVSNPPVDVSQPNNNKISPVNGQVAATPPTPFFSPEDPEALLRY